MPAAVQAPAQALSAGSGMLACKGISLEQQTARSGYGINLLGGTWSCTGLIPITASGNALTVSEHRHMAALAAGKPQVVWHVLRRCPSALSATWPSVTVGHHQVSLPRAQRVLELAADGPRAGSDQFCRGCGCPGCN